MGQVDNFKVMYFNILNCWLGNTKFYDQRIQVLNDLKISEHLIELTLEIHELLTGARMDLAINSDYERDNDYQKLHIKDLC